ncbi:MAG: 4Fe-4S dicluster domain-containing protein [Desulfosalsimonas sp.]|uniref:4Fe-4S dicluster domain-containing protein n=1 Tax=Desulfosalsimonas sp. TaxID=3073848 RepID=UPI003970830E
MIKRSFIGISAPRLTYEVIEEAPAEPMTVRPAKRITLLMDAPMEKTSGVLLKSGDAVQQGQRLQLFENNPVPCAISPVAGKIESVEPFLGIMERQMTAVVIALEGSGDYGRDTGFKEVSKSAGLSEANRFLRDIPGRPDFAVFNQSDRPVKTIAVMGTEQDLTAVTQQYVIGTNIAGVKSGIDALRKLTGIQNIQLVVYPHMVQVAGSSGAGIKTVDLQYPAGSTDMIRMALEAKQERNTEVAFFTAEAAVAVGAALQTGELPVDKLLTVIRKDGSRQLIKAPVGTHVSDILEAVRQSVEAGDRVVLGGPMTGHAVFSLEQPITPDTDILMIQDHSEVPEFSDIPCTNCGSCVRVCPVNIPVNELVRYLDAGEYEQAAENASLFACIECGLCAYVCESQIPILQFIALAKHAVQRLKAAEEENA